VAQEIQRELSDLAAVNTMYVSLLKEKLGHAIPVPAWATGNITSSQDPPKAVALLHAWLDLLNLAVTPSLVRSAAWPQQAPDTAEALLRYLIRKHSGSESERDKADFLATMMFRNRAPSGQSADPKYPVRFAGGDPQAFEEQLTTVCEGMAVPELPVEQARILAEFQFLYEEFEELQDFNSLMESGMVVRVRELKASLGESFYHPRALAVMAAWNARFRVRFDELFHAATQQIKEFAASVQQEGASLLTRVEGDVTVKQLSDASAQAPAVLQQEYGRSHDKLRAISKLKKAVDTRQGSKKGAGQARAAAAGAGGSSAAAAAALSFQQMGFATTDETMQLRSLMNHISGHVKALESAQACVVPLPKGNLTLTPAEVEAYKADYLNEKSFRADYANAIRTGVAIASRINTELNELQSKRSTSAYLWKPHADSLATLIVNAHRHMDTCREVLKVAEQRGLADKLKGLNAVIQKLQNQSQHVATVLKSC
jgi:hypothetical protein